jgi:murein DD-endopeptidase MepM/ murein hydrolase activator NlpD
MIVRSRAILTLVFLGAALGVHGCARQAERTVPRRSSDIALVPDTAQIADRVPERATLATLLKGTQLRDDLIPAIVETTRSVFDPRKLHAGNAFQMIRTVDGLLRSFEYEIDLDRFLRVTAPVDQPTALTAEIVPYEKTRALVSMRAAIDKDSPSLFAAMETAGETPDLSIALADIFSGEIDFHSDLQPGDTFNLTCEKIYREGIFVAYGPIVAAEFVNDGRRLRAVRYASPDGKAGYYDENGRSVRRFFLRSPLKFVAAPRVTSGFSGSRFHPVLRIYRPHLGVDYGAPMGAPVVAVANGVVASAGWGGQGGNQVVLRHPSGYDTYYMHLSAITVRAGQRVSQGDLIGRVGMTGLATGPHLDYRIRRNGVFVNPLLEHKRLPPGEPIPPVYLADYQRVRDDALSKLIQPGDLGQR